eukprot:8789201-Prorocentrum_lima.AAC.1
MARARRWATQEQSWRAWATQKQVSLRRQEGQPSSTHTLLGDAEAGILLPFFAHLPAERGHAVVCAMLMG